MSLIIETNKGAIIFGNEINTGTGTSCEVSVSFPGKEQPVVQEWRVESSRPLPTPRWCMPEYDDKGRLRLHSPFDKLSQGGGINKRDQRRLGVNVVSTVRGRNQN